MPISFVAMRASSIPDIVNDQNSLIKAGITGSDILWNAGLGKDAGSEIPIYRYRKMQRWQPKLYLGVTEEIDYLLREMWYGKSTVDTLRQALIEPLKGYGISTKYPRIAREYAKEKKIKGLGIRFIPGTDEAMQFAYPNELGNLGTRVSNKTLGANDLVVLDDFYPVTIRWIQKTTGLTRWEENVLEDLKGRLDFSFEKARLYGPLV